VILGKIKREKMRMERSEQLMRVSTNPCFRNLLPAPVLCPPPWTPAPWECIPPSAPESLEGILATDEPHHCVRGVSEQEWKEI